MEKVHEAFRTRDGLIYLKENSLPKEFTEVDCESGYAVFGDNEEIKFYPINQNHQRFYVVCKTKAEYFAVLLWHERMGHKWCTGVEPMYHHKLWDVNKEKSVVGIYDGFTCVSMDDKENVISFDQFCQIYVLLKK